MCSKTTTQKAELYLRKESLIDGQNCKRLLHPVWIIFFNTRVSDCSGVHDRFQIIYVLDSDIAWGTVYPQVYLSWS